MRMVNVGSAVLTALFASLVTACAGDDTGNAPETNTNDLASMTTGATTTTGTGGVLSTGGVQSTGGVLTTMQNTSGQSAASGGASTSTTSTGAMQSTDNLTNSGGADAAMDMMADAQVTGGTMSGDMTMDSDTWDNYAKDFVDTYCVSCHPSILTPIDFTTYEGVVAYGDKSRCGVAPTMLDGCTGDPAPSQFPAGAPYPTDDERLRFVAWIEAGMPQ